MSNALKFVFVPLFFCLLSSNGLASDANSENHALKVLTSFSILADWTKTLGEDSVEVTSLVGLDADVHAFSATSKDLKKLAQADIMIINGLQLEGAMTRLIKSSGFDGQLIVASDGIDKIVAKNGNDHSAHEESESGHDHHHHHHHEHSDDDGGIVDPHAWTSVRAAGQYLDNIAAGLIKAKPQKRSLFEENLANYKKQLKSLDETLIQQFSGVPADRRVIVLPHNSMAYFARDYDIKVYSLKNLDTVSESSAASFAKLVRSVKSNKALAVFGENIGNNRLIERIVAESNLSLSGLLVTGALSESVAPDYISMIRHNSNLILKAL